MSVVQGHDRARDQLLLRIGPALAVCDSEHAADYAAGVARQQAGPAGREPSRTQREIPGGETSPPRTPSTCGGLVPPRFEACPPGRDSGRRSGRGTNRDVSVHARDRGLAHGAGSRGADPTAGCGAATRQCRHWFNRYAAVSEKIRPATGNRAWWSIGPVYVEPHSHAKFATTQNPTSRASVTGSYPRRGPTEGLHTAGQTQAGGSAVVPCKGLFGAPICKLKWFQVLFQVVDWYSWVDSNHRPPGPQPGALTN
jgi:hypothetical protein